MDHKFGRSPRGRRKAALNVAEIRMNSFYAESSSEFIIFPFRIRTCLGEFRGDERGLNRPRQPRQVSLFASAVLPALQVPGNLNLG